MLLTIDVGNTHTVLGLFDGQEIVKHWRISTEARRTTDEPTALLQGLMSMHPLLGDLGDGIDGIAICSTAPSVLHEPREVTRRYYGDARSILVRARHQVVPRPLLVLLQQRPILDQALRLPLLPYPGSFWSS